MSEPAGRANDRYGAAPPTTRDRILAAAVDRFGTRGVDAVSLDEIAGVAGTKGIMLVFDDFHLISTRAIHDGVSYLIDHLPSHVHLVIATRADPPLALARLRARGP